MNILTGICILIVIFVLSQIFIIASFKIPSDSMYPRIKTGDYILVLKPILGPRLFNINTISKKEKTTIYRLPGFKKIKHNDILVFNFPHYYTWEKIEINLIKYNIKRCVGLPGDSLQIRNGFYINNHFTPVGNANSQRRISNRKKETFELDTYHTFPFDSIFNWNIQNFGPFYIPKKSDILPMNYSHYVLYKKLIEWEQQTTVTFQDSVVYLNNQPLNSYKFQQDYYFMAGDWGEDSYDSRYWGLVPEEYIVGKAWIIWKSIEPYTNKFRWDRFMKKTQ